jgi:sulfite reductase alpha subunit-like flavoprotein
VLRNWWKAEWGIENSALRRARQGAAVFVCGSAQKMPQDVAAALEHVAMQEGGLSRAEAAAYLKQLEANGRYFVEAWS